jgi:hypothetical protein
MQDFIGVGDGFEGTVSFGVGVAVDLATQL